MNKHLKTVRRQAAFWGKNSLEIQQPQTASGTKARVSQAHVGTGKVWVAQQMSWGTRRRRVRKGK